MTADLRMISSMAMGPLLAELAAACEAHAGRRVQLESVGGVDAARRVRQGESFDAVVLARDVIDKLAAEGHVHAGRSVDLARSSMAVAVAAGQPHPDIGSEAALRAAVLAAPSIGYSTGPSGTALLQLLERWGIADTVRPRAVQAPPGVAVGTLLVRGDAALGFQQLSEFIHMEGIDIVGPLPPAVQVTTTFCAGVCTTSTQPDAVAQVLAFMAGPLADETRRRNGMAAARDH